MGKQTSGTSTKVGCSKCGRTVWKVYSNGRCSLCRALNKTIGGRKRKYGLAAHGSKGTIQKAFDVTGKTHESEHTIGYAVLSALKRGGSAQAKLLENNGLAYQEKHGYHRAHIGTGSQSTPDKSGLNASDYRSSQRTALEEGSASNAIQLNQLCYAFLDGFKQDTSEDIDKADSSFIFMLTNANRVTYAKPDGTTIHVGVDAVARCEAYLSRVIARTGAYPTDKEIGDAKRMFGIPTKL